MCKFRQSLVVKRFTGESYDVDGFLVEGTETQISIEASVQPATGKDTLLLPENRREAEHYKIYTDSALFTAEKGSSQSPDRVVFEGSDYEVMKKAPWRNGIINHFKYIISKVVSND